MTNIFDICVNTPSDRKDELSFLSWFDHADSVDESLSTGFTDFAYKIMSSDMCARIGNPSQLTCCEIGFGGGRLLLPASMAFKNVVGIDIHKEFNRVEARLKSYNRSNFRLINFSDSDSLIEDESLHFVYSFITFQHFSSWSTAEYYIDLICRKLKTNGHGIIYFGENIFTQEDIKIDDANKDGFPMTLFVKRSFIENHLSKKGLKIIEIGSTTKTPWSDQKSSQFFVKFQRVE